MARKNLNEWLHGEIKSWVQEGLISRSQAELLAARYPLAGAGLPWGAIIFSCLGALVAGLGVILLLAYNWDVIPKFGKLGIILAALAGTHAMGIKFALGAPRQRALGEGICLLGTMLFGAGIFLVAQIYHIDEHFPNAFLIWGAGALLMGLVLNSIPQAILAAALLTIWSGTERLEFDSPMWLAPLIVAVVLAPQAYLKRSRILAAVVIPAFLLCYAFALPGGYHTPWLTFSTLLSLSAILIAKSYLVRVFGTFRESAAVLGAYGWAVFFLMLFLMSFPALSRTFFEWRHDHLGWQHYIYWALPLAGCLSAWLLMAREELLGVVTRESDDPGLEVYLVPLTVLLGLCDVFYLRQAGGWAVAGPFNLVFIGLAAALMAKGCREGLMKPTLIGSLLMVAVVVARYFDLFESLMVRGLVFLLLGALLLTEGVLYSKSRRQKAGGRT
jgi:uncharacterized membrane protein